MSVGQDDPCLGFYIGQRSRVLCTADVRTDLQC